MLSAAPTADDADITARLACHRIYRELEHLPPKPPTNPLARLQGLTVALTDAGTVDVADSPESAKAKAYADRIKKLERWHQLATLLHQADTAAMIRERLTQLRHQIAPSPQRRKKFWRP